MLETKGMRETVHAAAPLKDWYVEYVKVKTS